MGCREYRNLGEEVWHEQLYSGLNVFVVPKKSFSRTYAFLAVRYGGCDRRFSLDGKWQDTPAGVAHFLEHKMFDMPDGSNVMEQFSRAGASPNAFTSNGMTGYLFRCTEHFEENLQTLLRYVTTPYFTEESVAKEQGIIAQEIRMGEDDPGRRVFMELRRSLYDHHPAREDIAGTVESIAGITPETLYACHKAFYTPSNMVLCVAGNAEPERVRDIAADTLRFAAQSVPERDYGPPETLLPARIRSEAEMPVSAPLFAFGAKLPYEPDGRAFVKRLLTAELACGMLLDESSELYGQLYDKGLINPGAFYYGASDFPGGATLSVGGESREPYRVLDEVTEAAARLSAQPDAALFERLKKAMLGASIRSLDSVENICHNEAEAFFHGYSSFEMPEFLRSVSLEEVRACLEETFRLDRMAMSVIRPVSA